MQLGWIGGRLLGAGVAVFALGYGLMIAAIPYGNLVTGIGVVSIAAGSAALCVSPRPPFTGRISRFGLGVLAIGTACLVTSAFIAAGMTFDPLESMPVVVFGFAGLVLTPVGVIVTLLAQVRRLVSRS